MHTTPQAPRPMGHMLLQPHAGVTSFLMGSSVHSCGAASVSAELQISSPCKPGPEASACPDLVCRAEGVSMPGQLCCGSGFQGQGRDTTTGSSRH